MTANSRSYCPIMVSRRTVLATVVGSTAVAASLPTQPAAANNFGSRSGVPDTGEQVFMSGSSAQDWSVTFILSGMSSSEQSTFQYLVAPGVEYTYEPTDLTVTKLSDSTSRDIRYVPINGFNSNEPALVGLTFCDILNGSVSIYGSHHHRVCTRKKINIYEGVYLNSGLSDSEQKYNVLAHEFGHGVGLRHSNMGDTRGTSTTGAVQPSTHPDPGGSLMYSTVNIGAATSLHAHDVAHIDDPAHYG